MHKLERLGEITPTYWGAVQTLVGGGEYTAKRIWMNAGTQSSLEYHVDKKETYIIESGMLIVGLRKDRARNTRVVLAQGDVFTIYPGQMHMRIAPRDVTILEISTYDNPHDTYFVEDGKTYTHVTGGDK